MKIVQYHYNRSRRVIAGVIFLILWLLCPLVKEINSNGFSNSNAVFLFSILKAVALLMAMIQFLHAIRTQAFACIDINGINIFKRPRIETAKILWKDVCKLTYIPAASLHKPAYIMIVTSYSATLGGTPAFTQTSALSEKVVKNYLLDETMEKLAHGDITQEQFVQQGVYLMAATKADFGRLEKAWKAQF